MAARGTEIEGTAGTCPGSPRLPATHLLAALPGAAAVRVHGTLGSTVALVFLFFFCTPISFPDALAPATAALSLVNGCCHLR